MRIRKQNSEKMVIRKDDGVSKFVDEHLDELNEGIDLRNSYFDEITKGWHRGKSRFKIGGVYQDENGDFLTILNMDVDSVGNIRAKCRYNSDEIDEWLIVQIYEDYEIIELELYNRRKPYWSSCWESSI